ncbi:MAG TPA: OB-fold nucleic acid binding domain-containing protein [Solirubrobacteraceae bacterium]
MKTKLTIAAATAALATGGLAAAGATASPTTAAKAPTTASAAATRHVEGRVTAIDRSARTFTVRDAQRGTLEVKVSSSTKFERVTFSSLRTGTRVDVRAKRVAGAWSATKVERGVAADNHDAAGHDAGDDHGGRHGGGADDGPNHS